MKFVTRLKNIKIGFQEGARAVDGLVMFAERCEKAAEHLKKAARDIEDITPDAEGGEDNADDG